MNPSVWRALAIVLNGQRVFGWGLPPEEASVEKRARLGDRVLQAALRARDLVPLDSSAPFTVALGYFATCQADRALVEGQKAAALNPYSPLVLGSVGQYVVHGSRGRRRCAGGQSHQAGGSLRQSGLEVATAKRAWLKGEYQEAYEAFQHGYFNSFWLSQLDLAYTLPFLGRIDEAKQQVAALLKMAPTMTIREADAFYKLVCFDAAYRDKMAGALRQAGLPE